METGTFRRLTSSTVLLILAAGASAQFTSYPQPSSNAATDLPQDRVTQYSGTLCYCDLTAHACDSNCCCDKLCTAADHLLFTACTQETAVAPELNYCIDEALLATVLLSAFLSVAIQSSNAFVGTDSDSRTCANRSTCPSLDLLPLSQNSPAATAWVGACFA